MYYVIIIKKNFFQNIIYKFNYHKEETFNAIRKIRNDLLLMVGFFFKTFFNFWHKNEKKKNFN